MERRITKVRYKEGKIEIHEAEEEVGVDETSEKSREITTKCAEPPRPEFLAALKRLVPHVRTILELPADYCEDRIEITGASFSRTKEGIDGATISGRVKLDTALAPFHFNTPHLSFQPTSAESNQPLMPDEAQADLIMLRSEVQAYLDGKRAQEGLFDGKAAAAGEGREQVEEIARAHGMPDSVIETVANEMAGQEPTISINGGPEVPMSTMKRALKAIKGGKEDKVRR